MSDGLEPTNTTDHMRLCPMNLTHVFVFYDTRICVR